MDIEEHHRPKSAHGPVAGGAAAAAADPSVIDDSLAEKMNKIDEAMDIEEHCESDRIHAPVVAAAAAFTDRNNALATTS